MQLVHSYYVFPTTKVYVSVSILYTSYSFLKFNKVWDIFSIFQNTPMQCEIIIMAPHCQTMALFWYFTCVAIAQWISHGFPSLILRHIVTGIPSGCVLECLSSWEHKTTSMVFVCITICVFPGRYKTLLIMLECYRKSNKVITCTGMGQKNATVSQKTYCFVTGIDTVVNLPLLALTGQMRPL